MVDHKSITDTMARQETMLLDFSQTVNNKPWQIINDAVMGGVSKSNIGFTEHGSVVFQGQLSFENSGGFASTRTELQTHLLNEYIGLLLQVRGDGKLYQLRLRTNTLRDGIAYRYRFQTVSDNRQCILAPFSDFEPVFRGRIVSDAPPLTPADIMQIGFLIADKQEGEFRLEIDWLKAYANSN